MAFELEVWDLDSTLRWALLKTIEMVLGIGFCRPA